MEDNKISIPIKKTDSIEDEKHKIEENKISDSKINLEQLKDEDKKLENNNNDSNNKNKSKDDDNKDKNLEKKSNNNGDLIPDSQIKDEIKKVSDNLEKENNKLEDNILKENKNESDKEKLENKENKLENKNNISQLENQESKIEEKKNEINLVIKTKEDWDNYFISQYFEDEEYEENMQYIEENVEIYIDNIKQEFTRKIDAEIFPEEREYHVKLKFKILFTNCSKMFYDCNNITNIDLTNFDTSKYDEYV